MKRPLFDICFFAAILAPASVLADEPPGKTREYRLVIENHRFKPEQITIPANTKVRFVVENRDTGPEEFDSRDLDREKVLTGNSKGTVYIGPLQPGSYKFQGEYHAATAQGVVTAK